MARLEMSAHRAVRPGCLEEFPDDHFMTLDGEVSPPLLDLLKPHRVGHEWFSLAHGMEVEP